ncbi:hypothetical protein [Collimonas fungivorans]|uniref:hypothetical protein n=1 Tax=Collimonas fungivorans TaxID=158899 RepID=UPI0005A03164|nr:hypothetical protein [Collimonas fungivorans]
MDLAHIFDFDLQTANLGTLRIGPMESDFNEKLQIDAAMPDADGRQLAQQALIHTARKKTGDAATGTWSEWPSLAETEVEEITLAELGTFSERLAQRYFTSNSDGTRGPVDGGPSGVDFLISEINKSKLSDERRIAQQFEEIRKSPFSSATMKAMEFNSGVSTRLGEAIGNFRNLSRPPIESLYIPSSSPIQRTNEALETLLENVEQMRPVFAMCAELIQSMNSTALKMQEDSIAASAQAEKRAAQSMKFATIGIWISGLTFIVSSLFSIYTIMDAGHVTSETVGHSEALSKEIHDMTVAVNSARLAFERSATEDRTATIKAPGKIQP